MGTVFCKNTTSSPITVAGHRVYYIDSTDAEIVEVEKTQPANIDVWLYLSGIDSIETKTFSANDYWNSRVIDATDEQALRDFGVSLVNLGGDPIVYGIDSSNSDFGFAPLGLYSGLRTGDLNADMSNFYVADGGSTWSNRKCIWSRSAYSTPALTWKCRITKNGGGASKYNAFKYSLSGTPYWYVIDGTHDTWTDDLSEWGYSEVPVGPVLPEVGSPYWLAPDTGDGTSTVQPNALQSCVESLSTHEKVAFNSSMSYGVNFWKNPDNTLGGHSEFSIANVNGYVGIKNVSNRAIAVYWVNYAICSDSTATVVTVYNSSNVAYNAFKFTANNTDYYYVLDGTQTDWTDDLAGIGYSLNFTAYASATKEPFSLSGGTNTPLYDSSGNNISPPGTPSLVRYYTSSSDTTGSTSSSLSLTSGFYGLTLYNSSSSGTSITVQRVEYTVS